MLEINIFKYFLDIILLIVTWTRIDYNTHLIKLLLWIEFVKTMGNQRNEKFGFIHVVKRREF
jgi:hypothetical protein